MFLRCLITFAVLCFSFPPAEWVYFWSGFHQPKYLESHVCFPLLVAFWQMEPLTPLHFAGQLAGVVSVIFSSRAPSAVSVAQCSFCNGWLLWQGCGGRMCPWIYFILAVSRAPECPPLPFSHSLHTFWATAPLPSPPLPSPPRCLRGQAPLEGPCLQWTFWSLCFLHCYFTFYSECAFSSFWRF